MGLMRMSVPSALPVGTTDQFDDERAQLRSEFLIQNELGTEELIPLPIDASFRKYFRYSGGLLMDAPAPHESTESFQRISDILSDSGLSVPCVYSADHENGFLLIEDFGTLKYRQAMEEGIPEAELYGETVKALAHLHQHISENTYGLPGYDLDLFLEKACLFTEWVDVSISEQAKDEFVSIWKELYRFQPNVPHSLMLRDVMVDNLIWLPARRGFQRSGFIDFQDALWGPVTYDLVSLLEDARRDIAPTFAQDMLKLYLDHFPGLSRDDFWASYYFWGAQRTTRIIGVFHRLAKRDGKTKYLSHLPRLWGILKRDLEHPHLQDLKMWFQGVMP